MIEELEDFVHVANALLNGGALVLLKMAVREVRDLTAEVMRLQQEVNDER